MSGWAAIGAVTLLVPLLWGGGCSRSGKDWNFKEMFPNPSAPPKELGWMEDPDPDKRREAIAV
ncbi:MAG: hypothetical protein MUP47_05815, partial [Phycisphaerae bacterium]|nr:hypothetical protein [Phycisphaerae bacterium]